MRHIRLTFLAIALLLGATHLVAERIDPKPEDYLLIGGQRSNVIFKPFFPTAQEIAFAQASGLVFIFAPPISDNWPISFMLRGRTTQLLPPLSRDSAEAILTEGVFPPIEFSFAHWLQALEAYSLEADAIMAAYANSKKDTVFVGIGRSPSFAISMMAAQGYTTLQLPFSTHSTVDEAALKAYLEQQLVAPLRAQSTAHRVVFVDLVNSGETLARFLDLVQAVEPEIFGAFKIDIWAWKDAHSNAWKLQRALPSFGGQINLRFRDIAPNRVLRRLSTTTVLTWTKEKALFPKPFETYLEDFTNGRTAAPSDEHLSLIQDFMHLLTLRTTPRLIAPAPYRPCSIFDTDSNPETAGEAMAMLLNSERPQATAMDALMRATGERFVDWREPSEVEGELLIWDIGTSPVEALARRIASASDTEETKLKTEESADSAEEATHPKLGDDDATAVSERIFPDWLTVGNVATVLYLLFQFGSDMDFTSK